MTKIKLNDVSLYHRQAAFTYVGLGIIVIFITFAAGLVPAGRSNPIAELSVGAVFLLLFSLLVYRGWWPITALLLLSNSWRVFTYLNDGRGWHVELFPFSMTQVEPQPVAFLNAALMAVIVFMLARSAWAGFSAWRTRRLTSISS